MELLTRHEEIAALRDLLFSERTTGEFHNDKAEPMQFENILCSVPQIVLGRRTNLGNPGAYSRSQTRVRHASSVDNRWAVTENLKNT